MRSCSLGYSPHRKAKHKSFRAYLATAYFGYEPAGCDEASHINLRQTRRRAKFGTSSGNCKLVGVPAAKGCKGVKYVINNIADRRCQRLSRAGCTVDPVVEALASGDGSLTVSALRRNAK